MITIMRMMIKPMIIMAKMRFLLLLGPLGVENAAKILSKVYLFEVRLYIEIGQCTKLHNI